MARPKRSFVCRECGEETTGWTGRCPSCQAWATVEEVSVPTSGRSPAQLRADFNVESVSSLRDLEGATTVPSPTGVDEIDRVLGGGLTPGSVTLLGGEPGVGKSTLTLQLALAVAGRGASVLLVAGEEAPGQIAARAARLGKVPATLSVIDDPSIDAIIGAMETLRPQVAIVDSIQTVRVGRDGSPGSVGQLKAATEQLVLAAKRLQVSVVMVGHVTKDGTLAGPRVIEHLVDTVLSFGGDRSGELRYLRTVKHRFGPTTEVGLLEMTAQGLSAVADPSDRFLTDRQPGLPGSIVVASVDGRRPILVEVQALTVSTGSDYGHVSVQGVDKRRLAMVSAVLGKMVVASALARHDVFVSSTGGVDLTEPAVDLGMAIALVSALTEKPVRPDLVACGEIGLGGEIRSVPLIESRLQEAFRLGFRSALVPASAPDGPAGMTLLRGRNINEALAHLARPLAA